MVRKIAIDYPPNQRLYVLIRKDGQVWHNKKNKYVDWDDEEMLCYCINLRYKGGDRYICDVPNKPEFQTGKFDVQIFKMRGREPSEYDQFLDSNAKLKVVDYPTKHRGFNPGERMPIT